MSYRDEIYLPRLKVGQEYEKFIVKLFKDRCKITITIYNDRQDQYNIGESVEGYEIKRDGGIKKYKDREYENRNLAIETYEKSDPDNENWIESGILRKDNTIHYVQGNEEYVWVFWKKDLVYEFEKKKWPHIIGPTLSSKLMLLPLLEADKLRWMKIYV